MPRRRGRRASAVFALRSLTLALPLSCASSPSRRIDDERWGLALQIRCSSDDDACRRAATAVCPAGYALTDYWPSDQDGHDGYALVVRCDDHHRYPQPGAPAENPGAGAVEPDGGAPPARPWIVLPCPDGMSACATEASKACPIGYLVADSNGNVAGFGRSGAEPPSSVMAGGRMVFRCVRRLLVDP